MRFGSSPRRPSGRGLRRRTALGSVAALGVGLLASVAVAPPASAAPPAYLATLAGPSQAAMYPSGEEYDAVNDRLVVADTGRDRVLFYSLTGQKLGGFGEYGAGPGQFASPRDVAVDDVGNVYVADAENNRVQAFTSAGVFRWQKGGLGTGNETLNTPIGVTWDSVNDVLLVASTGQSLIKAWDANGVYKWKSPTGNLLTAHAMRDVSRGPDGRMWVTAYKEHQIKVYDVTAAGVWRDRDVSDADIDPVWVLGDGATNGNGVNQMNFPYNVEWSPDGNTVYVSDTGNGRITRWDLSGTQPQWLEPFGGRCAEHPQPCADPPTDAGQFNHLRRVAVDAAGRVYGADFWGAGVEVFNPDGSVARSIEGDEPPAPGFSEAYGVDVAPSGEVYVMDRLNHRIQRFRADGTYVGKVGARGTQPATFSWPEALAVGPDNDVWAVDTRGDRIERFPADLATTPTVPSYGSTGAGLGQLNYPEGADVDANGVVYVADTRNDRIQKFSPASGTWTAIGAKGTGPGQLSQPMGVAVTGDAIFVADTLNNRVQKLSLSGAPLATFATGLRGPEGLEVAPDGTVWVADTQNSRIVHLSANLTDLGDGFGSLGAGNTQLDRPHDVAIGNDKLYVADTYNSRVQVFDLEQGGTEPPPPFNPTYGSQISAPGGHAPVYPAGVAIATDGTWFVADSGGSRVVTIDPGTDQVTPVATAGLTDPRDLELDLADPASLWVTDTGGNRLVKLSRTGQQQATLTGLNQPYGLANDATRVYAANTYGNNVRAYTKAGGSVAWTQSTCFGTAFSRPRDVGLAGSGQLLVADTDNDRIVVLNASTGACQSTFGTRGTGAGQFKSPRSVTSDGGSGVWVADALNYRVQHLSLTGASLGGTPVNAAGEAPTQFRSPHCVTPVPGTNRVAVCDTFNFRISVYNGATNPPSLVDTVAGTRPAPGGFNGPFGAAYGPNGELYVADWFNHRIQKFHANGTFDREWGGYGPQNGSLIFPRNVLVADNGEVVVTDSENNRIDVFSPTGAFLRQVKPPAGSALSRPHQVATDGSGGFWVADTNNNRVVHLGATGSVLGSFTPSGTNSRPQGIVVDTDGTLVVSNTNGNRVERYSATGQLVGTVLGSTQVSRPAGLLLTGSGASRRLWVSDLGNDRVHVLDASGAVVRTFGSTGAGAGQLNDPRGIAVDPTDGDIAVADFANDRISLWKSSGTASADAAAPTVTFTTPSADASVPAGTVTVSGSAADDVSVASVTATVRRASDARWLQTDGTWGTSEASLATTVAEPGAPTTAWSLPVPAGTSGGYTVTARVTDGAARSGTATRSFSVSSASTDTTAPDTAITQPGADATVGSPVTLAGTASDNVGVASVRVGVKDRVSGLWLQDDGSWSSRSGAFRLAVLDSANAAATSWTLELGLPVGDYAFTARAVDTAGLVDATATFRQFQVRSGDSTPADGTLTSPANNASVPPGAVTLLGRATDNVAVGSVKVAVQDTVSKQWLRADGTFATGYATVDATLTDPGSPSTGWSFVFTPPAARKYGVSVIAADLDGNIDPTKPWSSFTVTS